MNWFIKRKRNGYTQYLHKDGRWVNPITYHWEALVHLKYASAKELCEQMKQYDPTVCFVNGVKEKLEL